MASQGAQEDAGSDSDWSSPPPSSIDSDELQELMDELQIVPPRQSRPTASTKRPFGWPGGAGASSQPTNHQQAPGRRAADAAQTAAAAAARRLQANAAKSGAAAAEIIDILDSSDSEGEWRTAAPSTAQKRRVVDSSSEDDGDEDGGSAATALPPFFAAIPSLVAPTTAQPRQQHAAPPPPRKSAAVPPAASSSRPLSASAFKRQREEMTAQLFAEFNRTVFGGQLPADLEITWNARLLTTAGLTHYRRDIPDDPYAPPMYTARVELSSKVLDGFGKLERTLCHELCHVAAWLVDHTAKPPHGPVFKRWADRAMRLYTHLDITTCHAYQIFYPFRWQCSNSGCLQEYGRHSNSIDVAKKVCGACRCPLTFLGRFKPDGTPAKQRAGGTSKYMEFVKENHAEIRAQLPTGTPQKVVMQHVGARYAEARQRHRQRHQQQQQQQQQQQGASKGVQVGTGSASSAATTLLQV